MRHLKWSFAARMGTFVYRGFDSGGRRVRGSIVADNAMQAREDLRKRGLRISRIRAQSSIREYFVLSSIKRWRYQSALTESLRELTTLLQAGVPLLEAIDSCLLQMPTGLSVPISSVRERVASGSSVADAMETEKWLFDELTIGMVRVGEHSGNLDDVLDQIATFREQSSQMKDRVLSAIMYPAIVLFVSIAVTLFLMTVVVPMLLENLLELGTQLPWPTRALKTASDILLDHGWWLGLGFSIFAALASVWSSSATGKRWLGRVFLATPIMGNLIRKQSLSRVSLTIACLLRSGIELVEAIRIASGTCGNMIIRESFTQVAVDIERGQGLREVIERQSVFPPSLAQVFALGQQSGQLESMLQRLGTDYQRQTTMLAARVTAIVEPVLILVLSVIVGFIMFATILPILESGNLLTR